MARHTIAAHAAPALDAHSSKPQLTFLPACSRKLLCPISCTCRAAPPGAGAVCALGCHVSHTTLACLVPERRGRPVGQPAGIEHPSAAAAELGLQAHAAADRCCQPTMAWLMFQKPLPIQERQSFESQPT